MVVNEGYSNMIDQLKQHFAEQGSMHLQQIFTNEQFATIQQAIQSATFRVCVDPLHYRYSHADIPQEIQPVLSGLLDFVANVTDISSFGQPELLSLSWKDYSLLQDEQPGVDVIFEITPEWDERAGGMTVYRDAEGESMSFPLASNSVVVVDRRRGLDRFIQYVNHYGLDKRRVFVRWTSQ